MRSSYAAERAARAAPPPPPPRLLRLPSCLPLGAARASASSVAVRARASLLPPLALAQVPPPAPRLLRRHLIASTASRAAARSAFSASRAPRAGSFCFARPPPPAPPPPHAPPRVAAAVDALPPPPPPPSAGRCPAGCADAEPHRRQAAVSSAARPPSQSRSYRAPLPDYQLEAPLHRRFFAELLGSLPGSSTRSRRRAPARRPLAHGSRYQLPDLRPHHQRRRRRSKKPAPPSELHHRRPLLGVAAPHLRHQGARPATRPLQGWQYPERPFASPLESRRRRAPESGGREPAEGEAESEPEGAEPAGSPGLFAESPAGIQSRRRQRPE